MNRKGKIVLILLSIILLASCSNSNDNITEEPAIKESIEEIAMAYANDLINGEYEKAYSEYIHDSKMKKAVNAQEYEAAFNDLESKAGKFIEFKGYDITKSGKYDIVSIHSIFENMTLNLNVVFDESKKIAGFRFAPYTLEENTNSETIEIPNNVKETEVQFGLEDTKLNGTLTTPKEGTNFPVLVLVHGSGTNDKDETIGPNKPFRDIAWGLAEEGIAVLRYDKRTYTYQEKYLYDTEFTLYEETIEDAVEAVKFLKELDNIDENNIFVLGHSLGGYSIPKIAQETEDSAGFIILSGNARPLEELIPEQYDYIFSLDGTISDEEKEHLDNLKLELDKFNNLEELNDDEILFNGYKTYWLFLKNYKPAEEAKKINKPLLILQGLRDYQVTIKDYNIWHESLSSKENVTFKTYENLNHLIMPGEGASNPEEYQIPNHVSEEVIKDIANWIKNK